MIYDIIGIGIGPFNLGLAALSGDIPHLNTAFFDQSPEFQWHPGMMLSTSSLQVPFYADLVTVVNPCSPFTFLNYLKSKKRLFRFAIHENNFITRMEYNDYCRWVTSKLDNLHFDSKVEYIDFLEEGDLYRVMVSNQSTGRLQPFITRNLVLGTGTSPNIPLCIKNIKHKNIIHSSDYLYYKKDLLSSGSITIIGSGQSAAEIFYDLINHSDHKDHLHWFTRSERFYPMEYSKLSLEMTSIDYIDHFYSLSPSKKQEVLRKQNMLYKGINYSLINNIYDALYLKQLQQEINIHLGTNSELKSVRVKDDQLEMTLFHAECEKEFQHTSKSIILATGYHNVIPSFIRNIRHRIQWNTDNNYQVNRNYSIDVENKSIFIQNAELHTHGFSAPDLGMGPCRNATILNSILGHEYYKLENNIAFQTFGISGCY